MFDAFDAFNGQTFLKDSDVSKPSCRFSTFMTFETFRRSVTFQFQADSERLTLSNAYINVFEVTEHSE